MRLAGVIIAALVATACKKPSGPAEKVGLSFVAQTTDGVELRFTIYGVDSTVLEPETGTVLYSVYDGLPAAGRGPVCEARGTISKESYRVPKGVEHVMEVRPTWTKPCPPAGAPKRYGFISYVAPDGKVAKTKESMVPPGLGGSGKFEFPELDVQNADAGPPPRAAGDVLREKLRALGAIATPDDVPVGRACPTHAPVKSALRIDRRLVPPPTSRVIGADVEAAFRAVNDEDAQAFVRALQAGNDPPGKDVDFVELVKVETFEPPKLTDVLRAGQTGTYEPGKFIGEVWVVDLAAKKVLCRARAAATSTSDVKGKTYEVGGNLERNFAGAVGAAINKSAREIAPWLPNTWP